LIELLNSKNLENLIELDFKNDFDNFIGDLNLISVSNNCKILHLNYCSKILVSGSNQITKKLKNLLIHHCKNITDQSYCRNLKLLISAIVKIKQITV
jgi:hypothetical protein